ncbi:MAG: hypothetical protein AAFY15_12840 [Cyanobacteria bacterium J06648_11]
MTEARISPLTSDYIQELCQHKDGLQAIGVGNGASLDDAAASLEDQLTRAYADANVRVEKARKLELLVRWHKMLASRSSSGAEQLGEVEQQIFQILRGEALTEATATGIARGSSSATTPVRPAPAPNGVSDISVVELLKICNYICEKGIFYLGGVTSTYLEASRPQFDWLQSFEIHRSGRLQYSGNTSEVVSTLELYWCRRWMSDFIAQCSDIVQGFADSLDDGAIAKLGLNLQAREDEEMEALMAGFRLD